MVYVYNEPVYEQEADIEAGNDDPLIIRDLIESYELKIGPAKMPYAICTVSAFSSF